MRVISLFLLLVAACERPNAVAVTVRGLRAVPTAQALRVTLERDGGQPWAETMPRSGLSFDDEDTALLGFSLPMETAGRVSVGVAALEEVPFVLARGTGEGELQGPRLAGPSDRTA